MKHAFWAYFLIITGIVFIVIMLLIQRMSTINEEDFYLGREVMEAAMIDAVDYGTYRTSGRLVMSEQKFVEVFLRRFAESVTNTKTYEISFYDIYEEPPKATVKIRTNAGATNIDDDSFDFNLDTLMTGILETIYGQDGDSSNAAQMSNVKRYIICTGANAYLYNTAVNDYVQYDVTPGTMVTLKYDMNTYTDEADGINSICNHNIDGLGSPTANQKYCKVNYGGRIVYIQRGGLTIDNPNCNVVKLNYNNNGGKGCDGTNSDPDHATANKGSDWGELCVPSRSCYTFAGWFTAASGGTQIKQGDVANTTQTAYAHWTPAPCTLTYNSNGGNACSPSSVTKNGGQTWGTLCTPTRANHTFGGWYTSTSGGSEVRSNTVVGSNLTVFAKWTRNQATLTYNNNGGSGCSSLTKNAGETWGTLCTPTRTGYTFNGWYTSASGGTRVTGSETASSNITVYAQWTGSCSESNPSGCTLMHSCRVGNTFIYSKAVDGFSSTVNNNIEFYAIGEPVNGRQYVILKDAKVSAHAYYGIDIPTMDRGWIATNCIRAVGTCTPEVCPG